jgi:hypothetical protein
MNRVCIVKQHNESFLGLLSGKINPESSEGKMNGLESEFAGGGGRGLVRHARVSNPHLVPRLRTRGTEKARPESHVTYVNPICTESMRETIFVAS